MEAEGETVSGLHKHGITALAACAACAQRFKQLFGCLFHYACISFVVSIKYGASILLQCIYDRCHCLQNVSFE